MNIGFIGAGKVGCAYGRYLKEQGLKVYGYYSKSKASSDIAAKFTDSLSSDLNTLIENCDYIFITTPDDVISNIWDVLKSFNLQDKKIFHMSGSISSAIFYGIASFGAHGYSLHPIFPISDKNAYKDLSSAVFTIEGRNISEIEDFLSLSKIKYFEINTASKAKYHAAAVFASNYLVSLAKISRDLLLECSIPENEALNALLPLVEGTLKNIREKGVEAALTGPIARGDIGTLKKHLEVMDRYMNSYVCLGRVAAETAFDGGMLDIAKRDEILKLLGGNHIEKDNSLL